MKCFKLLLALCMFLVTITACKQDVLGPLPNDGTTPKPISDPVVQNMSGSALITYTLPDDPSLSYVRAEYELNGAIVDVKSSNYKRTILIEGFNDTLTHQVTLYAVSRGEKASTPVIVQIKPLDSPIKKVFDSFTVLASFGGVVVNINNPSLGNVTVGVLLYDTILKKWNQIDTYYTNLAQAQFSTRGLDSITQQFGFFAKDRWNNKSDTLKLSIKPIYEMQLDATKFIDKRKMYPIPQMPPLPASGLPMKEAIDYSASYPFSKLFDGNVATFFHTSLAADFPFWLPFDLGKVYRLSRYKLWQRIDANYIFSHGNPHAWELWGTNTPSDVNSWVKLTSETMVKPSGLPLAVNSNDDVALGITGQEYMFPFNVKPVRYIAWKNIDSWAAIQGATGFFHLNELIFWGQIVN